jgi:hypothetical protein
MIVNININNFPKGMNTLAMWSNGPLPQVYNFCKFGPFILFKSMFILHWGEALC